MDGFNLSKVIQKSMHRRRITRVPRFPQYAFVPEAEVRPYWELAKTYGLGDETFQSNFDQSFGAHLFLISGQAQGVQNVPNGHPWGCDSPPGTIVRRLPLDGHYRRPIFPCLAIPTLGEELDRFNLTWAYYAPRVDGWQRWSQTRRKNKRQLKPRIEIGQLWSAYDAIPAVRYGPSWQDNVLSPETDIVSDIRHGDLREVTWVVPDFANSDHSGSHSTTGPVWVSTLVDAIGTSRYWKDTAVVIVWDDSGGWYDHVVPPRFDYEGAGFRVPLIVVSSRSKTGYVSHRRREFGSVLRFIEDNFGVPTLSQRDFKADNLADFFYDDRAATSTSYNRLMSSEDEQRSLRSKPSYRPPDDD